MHIELKEKVAEVWITWTDGNTDVLPFGSVHVARQYQYRCEKNKQIQHSELRMCHD